MTAPTSFLDGLRDLVKPPRCLGGDVFHKHLTAEEVAEFENVARTDGANLAELRRYFIEHTGGDVSKDAFNRHMRKDCRCE